MKQNTKQAILEAAAPLITRQGFNRTGLKEILEAAGVPKGSFYFYFTSKEDFGLALIDHFRNVMGEFAAPFFSDGEMPPIDKLELFFNALKDRHCGGGFIRGCPIGNMTQEMSELSAPMRAKLSQALQGFSGKVAEVLSEAAARGELPGGLDPAGTAAFMVDAWEGALMRMKAEKGCAPLDRFMEHVFHRLLR